MKSLADTKCLGLVCSLLLTVLFVPAAWAGGVYQHGTVVRMRMGPCMADHHTFMMAMSGGGIAGRRENRDAFLCIVSIGGQYMHRLMFEQPDRDAAASFPPKTS